MKTCEALAGLVDERLTLEAFHALCGRLANVPFVKIVVVRENEQVHFMNNAVYQFHADYIAEQLLGESAEQLDQRLDEFNEEVYHSRERRFLLGTVSLHRSRKGARFFTLETVEVDTMGAELLKPFFELVKSRLDPSLKFYFKPNNHQQEEEAGGLPVVTASALYQESNFLPLNPGRAQGRLRVFTEGQDRDDLAWHDIIVMERVPDDIPRLAGIINAAHTTPLSHTNVLASGWQIPNAVQIGILDQIREQDLDGRWVRYQVDPKAEAITLEPMEAPETVPRKPAWAINQVRLESPDAETESIVNLSDLRLSDRYRYGTKAAHLGECIHLLDHGSPRLLGFYQLPRPPRENLLGHLSEFLGADESELAGAARQFLRGLLRIPRGLALPFSLQRSFLESSPQIQQTIGKLKMALQLEAREVDPLCVALQNMIRRTRIPDPLRERIDAKVAQHLLGSSSFVVRSSSNAEDLEDFSAAGVYESFSHVSTAENLFQSIKEVWASLLSVRSTRLRHESGISLDDAYMGVVIQEEVPAPVGGVMVTTNPTNRADYRNVYINASTVSVESVVSGHGLPIQYLFNTVEGGGRTLSLGDADQDLPAEMLTTLGKLAFAGRLLQSHFSPDYTFSRPVDIEWLANDQGCYLLQLRPYAK